MKIFLDTADIMEIREGVSMGLVQGVTTNPTLVAKTGRPFRKVIEDICSIVKGPVSAETVSSHAEGMIKDARKLAAIAPNIAVKIPMGAEGLKAVQVCANEGITINVTLIFQAIQGVLAAKAGASFVSPFIGRLDDIVTQGMDIVADLQVMLKNYDYKAKIIVASIRHPMHVHQAALIGADIVTMPFSVFTSLLKHPLTDIGIQKFFDDYKKIPKE
jgi:transaldolase